MEYEIVQKDFASLKLLSEECEKPSTPTSTSKYIFYFNYEKFLIWLKN